MNYRLAKKEDLPKVAKLLTRSFDGYPYFELYISDDKKRATFKQAIQRVNTMVNYKHDVLMLGMENGKILSVASLESPDEKPSGLIEYIGSGGLAVLTAGGIRNSFSFLSLLGKTVSTCHKEYPHAWYLSTLAISDSYQNRGIGSSMISECIVPFVKKRGGNAITLITNSAKNCVFYEKNGFHSFAFETFRVGEKELENWSFVREIPQT